MVLDGHAAASTDHKTVTANVEALRPTVLQAHAMNAEATPALHHKDPTPVHCIDCRRWASW